MYAAAAAIGVDVTGHAGDVSQTRLIKHSLRVIYGLNIRLGAAYICAGFNGAV